MFLMACGGSAPPAAPAAAPTRAPTAAAASSPRANASPGAAAVASPSPAGAPAARVQITDASIGDATPWISLKNTTSDPIILTDWKLQVGSATATIPGNAIAQPGETVTMHVKTGLSSERDIYLGTDGEALVKAGSPGASVKLTDPSGELVAETTVPRL